MTSYDRDERSDRFARFSFDETTAIGLGLILLWRAGATRPEIDEMIDETARVLARRAITEAGLIEVREVRA